MPYPKVHDNWVDYSPSNPINADALEHIEQGIADAHAAIDGRLSAASLDATYAPTGSGFETAVPDAVGEWWIWPLATYDAARNRTIGGGLSSDRGDGRANVIVWERNHGTGKVSRYVVGDAPVDDHNVPSVLLLPDGAVLVTWNYHNVDQVLRMKLSNRSGDLRTLVAAPEVTFAMGYDLSYTQAHLIAGDANSATFTVWQFVRLYRGDGWAWEIVPLTITNATRAIAKSATLRFLSGAANQAYAATARDPGTGRIRVMAGYNPAAARHELHAFEIDPASGAVTSLADPALAANVKTQTGVPINMTTAPAAIPDPGAGKSRRIFYPRPGPAGWAIAFADWDTANPDAGEYKLATGTPGTPDTVNGLSVNAGYASTPKDADWATTAGIEVKAVVTMGGTITADKELARRYVSASDRQFTLRVTASGVLKVNLVRAGNNAQEYTSAAVPGMFTGKIGVGFRWRHDGASGVLEFITSADGGATWTTHGSTAATGTYATIDESTAPLIVGSNVASFQSPVLFHATSYSTWDGTTATQVAAVQWDTLPGSTASGYVDPQGNTWTLTGDADVKSTTASPYAWTIHTLAPTGPRVGYTPLANYIGGAGFRTPCQPDDPVLIARRDAAAGLSYVEEHYFVNGTWVVERLVESADYLARPSRPIGGGPLSAVYTGFTEYDSTDYTQYQGNLHTA